MRIFNQVRVFGAATALLAMIGAHMAAQADDKAAGETWKSTVSMEMPGMTMPSRTLEVCVPPGKVQEALSKPQGPGMGDNCTMQDAKHDGNKFSAKLICTGQRPVEATIETIVEGDHAKTTMVMAMSGQQITMKTESQKVGTPCTPKDAAGRQNKARSQENQVLCPSAIAAAHFWAALGINSYPNIAEGFAHGWDRDGCFASGSDAPVRADAADPPYRGEAAR
ncbi:MAG: DUF3617 family protein [Steroidobacteraceae bacterium]